MNTVDKVIPSDRKKILTTYSCPVCTNSNYLEIVHSLGEDIEVTATCPRCRMVSVHYKNDSGHKSLALHDFRKKTTYGNHYKHSNSSDSSSINLSVVD